MNWYTLDAIDSPRSKIFINDTGGAEPVDFGGISYLDLDQEPIAAPVLPAYRSQILVQAEDSIFADGFESGDTTIWSATTP